VVDGVHVRVGTLSKALGSAGGFVAGSQRLVDWLFNRARPYVFSTAHPPAASAAASAALEIVKSEPERRTKLLANAANLRKRLTELGWNVGHSESQIIPLVIGAADDAMRLAAELREQGFLAPGIRPPSVPEGESLVRISLSYLHSREQIDALVDVLTRSKSK
jgi:7-keto-8-aminopelargonate synthetase-like enzyme